MKQIKLFILALPFFMMLGVAPAYAAHWNPLPDAGQTACFDIGNAKLDECPGVLSDPMYGQDGDYITPTMSLEDNSNGTFTDLTTGLTWPWGYPAEAYFEDAVNYCENLDLAGLDWRLPEIFELQTLIDYSRLDPAMELRIAPPADYVNADWLPILSATPSDYDPAQGDVVNIVDGLDGHVRYGSYGWIKCVHGEKPALGSYRSNPNSVTDNLTFLTWQKADSGVAHTWIGALHYCQSLSLEGKTDWRLPNIRELSSLLDFTREDRINTDYFSNSSSGYWSSTTADWSSIRVNGLSPYALRVSFYPNSDRAISFVEKSSLVLSTRCVRDGLTEKHRLSVALAGNGDGDVQGQMMPGGSAIIDCGTECAATLELSEIVKLTATPQAGSSFVKWAGDYLGASDCEGNTGICSIQMLDDSLVQAYFMPHKQLTVSKDGSGEGFVLSSPAGILCGTDCDQHYEFGTDVTLTATPAAGSKFWYWTGEGCSGNGECTVNMDSAKNVTATFAPNFVALHPLVTTKSGTGLGSITSAPVGINCGSDCFENYPVDSLVTLTANPDPGSIFSGWKGFPCFGTATTCTVTMDRNWTQDAAFTLDTTSPRQLSVTIKDDALGHSGNVTSSPRGINCGGKGADCTELYAYKTSVTLTATPDSDASFAGWSGDRCTGSSLTCTLKMDDALQVTASFGSPTTNKLLMVINAGDGLGTVTTQMIDGIDCGTDCEEIYPQNSQISLIATSAVGTNFLGWSGGGCSGVNACQIILLNNTTVTATFELDTSAQQELSVSKPGSGNGLVSSFPAGIDCGSNCSATYDYGSLLHLEAQAEVGNTFTGWHPFSSVCPMAGSLTCETTMDISKEIQAFFTVDVIGNGLCTGSNPVIEQHLFPFGNNFRCEADASITLQNEVSISKDAQVEVIAPVIKINSPFSVEAGGLFHAVTP